MKDWVKFMSVFLVVSGIIRDSLNAGGPTALNPIVLAQQASATLVRKVKDGYLHPDVLDDHEEMVQAILDAHPDVQNIPASVTNGK